MPVKVKYSIQKDSPSSLISSLFAVLSAILIGVVFWPILIQFLRFHSYPGAPLPVLTGVFYLVLFASTFLFALLTALFAKRTLLLSAICAIPAFLFYALDITGLRATILSFQADDVFHVYRSQPHSLAWWMVIVFCGVVILWTMRCFIRIALHRARTKNIGLLLACLSVILWLGYSVVQLLLNTDPALSTTGVTLSSRDFWLFVLYHLAALFFFLSVAVLLGGVRKSLIGESSGAEPFSPVPQPAFPASTEAPMSPLPAAAPLDIVSSPAEVYSSAVQAAQVVPSEEIIPEILPYDTTPVVSIEQAENLLQETKKKGGRSKKKAPTTVGEDTP